MLDEIDHLVEAGCALHWLHAREKRPIGNDWSTNPVWTAAQLRATYRDGNNLGLRLGQPSQIGDDFLQGLDVDIRKPERAAEAFAALSALLPTWESFPAVKSGSGGASIHVYFVTNQPFRSRKLVQSDDVFVDSEGKKHRFWEIELFGTGKQVAIPPSIHPDTGNPYRWLREIDFDEITDGLGPWVSADVVKGWSPAMAQSFDDGESDNDDFLAQIREAPCDFTDAQIKAILTDLPADWCEDHDKWIAVGMACHHQFEGREEGRQRWIAFSKGSQKFDEKDLQVRWKSFGSSRNTVTFRSLNMAAKDERIRRADAEPDDDEEDLIGEIEEDDDDDDLIGEISEIGPKLKWESRLDRTDEGVIKPTLHNVVIIIRNDPRTAGLPRLNLFTQEVVQRGAPGVYTLAKASPKGTKQLKGPVWEVDDALNGAMWTNARDVAVRDFLEAPKRQGGYGLKVTDRDLRGAIDLVARENEFHPIREYLSALKWDGTPRAEQLFVDYLGAPDDNYHRQVARMWLLAAVTRVFEPGHKFDFAVILEGIQGKRKSTFIEILARSWFAELDGDFHDSKAMVELMQGAWILEIPELQGFGRADIRTIKAFISRKTDKVRLAYERRAEKFRRQCVYMGSTNDQEYLRDDTGGRRFWPVECTVDAIDSERLALEIDQVWAEVYGLYVAMRKQQPGGTLPLYLSDTKAHLQALRVQESRRIENAEDAIAGKIEAWLDAPMLDESGFEDEDGLADGVPVIRNVTCLAEIWVECFQRDMAHYDQAKAQQLGRAMRKVEGWLQGATQHRTNRYGKQRVFVREGSEPI